MTPRKEFRHYRRMWKYLLSFCVKSGDLMPDTSEFGHAGKTRLITRRNFGRQEPGGLRDNLFWHQPDVVDQRTSFYRVSPRRDRRLHPLPDLRRSSRPHRIPQHWLDRDNSGCTRIRPVSDGVSAFRRHARNLLQPSVTVRPR